MGQNRKKINGKELVLDISYDIVGSVLYALGIYTFAKTADFAPGGLSGLANLFFLHPAHPLFFFFSIHVICVILIISYNNCNLYCKFIKLHCKSNI